MQRSWQPPSWPAG